MLGITRLIYLLRSVEIAKKSVYNVGLSATPIHNDVNDLSNIFSILFPDYSRDVWQLVISELWSKNRTDIVHHLSQN